MSHSTGVETSPAVRLANAIVLASTLGDVQGQRIDGLGDVYDTVDDVLLSLLADVLCDYAGGDE